MDCLESYQVTYINRMTSKNCHYTASGRVTIWKWTGFDHSYLKAIQEEQRIEEAAEQQKVQDTITAIFGWKIHFMTKD